MTSEVISTATTVPGELAFLQENEYLIVTQSGALISRDSPQAGGVLGLGHNTISIQGYVDAEYLELANNDQVTIGRTGTVMIRADDLTGVEKGAFKLGVNGSSSTLLNEGLIRSNAYGVSLSGGQNTVTNSGTIFGKLGGVRMGHNGFDLDTLDNSGTIASARGEAVLMNASSETVYNSGIITSDTTAALRASAETGLLSRTATIVNHGTIQSLSNVAIKVDYTIEGSLFILANTGTIQSTFIAYSGSNGLDQVTNSGILRGQVFLAGGTDVMANTGGQIFGNVNLGAGDDIYDGREGGRVYGTVTGGLGDDTYFTSDSTLRIVEAATVGEMDSVISTVNFRLAANVENLTLLDGLARSGFGNAGNNLINGNASDNVLNGFAGNDSLFGDQGDDRLLGGAGNDTLVGDEGDDVLKGELGNDTLLGGNGDDTLVGGYGRDALYGGSGEDVFVFTNIKHSTSTALDAIYDFVIGDDKIDLSAIDAIATDATANGAFTFIGTAAFHNTAGEVRIYTDTGATVVAMDVNGDGVADGLIRVSGVLALSAGDFVL